jgi:hypothetical protein
MAGGKDAWEREEYMKNAMVVVVDADEGGDDGNNSDYSWSRVHHGKRHGTLRGQRHEAKEGRVNGHSWVVGGMDMRKMVRLCSRSDACALEAVGSMKVPDVGKVIVCQAAYRHARAIRRTPNLSTKNQ